MIMKILSTILECDVVLSSSSHSFHIIILKVCYDTSSNKHVPTCSSTRLHGVTPQKLSLAYSLLYL
jgi:hypothetical protein